MQIPWHEYIDIKCSLLQLYARFHRIDGFIFYKHVLDAASEIDKLYDAVSTLFTDF
jgi:hypothetical protein